MTDQGPIIICLAGVALFAGIVIWGLVTGRMPARFDSFKKTEQPIAFWSTCFLWGICCMLFLILLIALL